MKALALIAIILFFVKAIWTAKFSNFGEYELDLKDLKGNLVSLDKERTADFKIRPIKMMKMPDASSKTILYKIPIELFWIILEFLDCKDWARMITTNKYNYWSIIFYLQQLIRIKIGLKVNVPWGKSLPFYLAFCLKTPDYARFEGLKDKVISLPDFIGLTRLCAFDRTDVDGQIRITFNGFIPDSMNYSIEAFMNPKSIKGTPCNLLSFKKLNYLIGAFGNKITTEVFLPYTFWALNLMERYDIKFFIIRHYKLLRLQVFSKLMKSLPLNSFVDVAVCVLRDIMILHSNVQDIRRHLGVILRGFRRATGINYSSLAKLLFLHRALNENLSECISFDDYAALLRGPLHRIVSLKNINYIWPKYYLSSIPEKHMQNGHKALTCLLSTPIASINFDGFFEEFGDPKIFQLCLDTVSRCVDFDRGPIFTAFIKRAIMLGVDLSVPRFDEYRPVFSLGILIKKWEFNQILDFCKGQNKPISTVCIDYDLNNRPFLRTRPKFFCGYSNPPFDVLYASFEVAKTAQRILNVDNVNLRFNVAILMFKSHLEWLMDELEIKSLDARTLEISSAIREWTFIELAFVLGKASVVDVILNHPGFDKDELNHQVDGHNGISFLFQNFIQKYANRAAKTKSELIVLNDRIEQILTTVPSFTINPLYIFHKNSLNLPQANCSYYQN